MKIKTAIHFFKSGSTLSLESFGIHHLFYTYSIYNFKFVVNSNSFLFSILLVIFYLENLILFKYNLFF